MTPRPPSPERTADPSARWEAIRREWTTPRSPSLDAASSAPPSPPNDEAPQEEPQPTKRQRDPLFQQRIAVLEQMLRSANAGPSGSKEGWNGSATPAAMLSVPAAAASSLRAGAAGETAGSGAGSGEGSAGREKGKERAMMEDEGIEPDGGDVIGVEKEENDPASQVRELKKVSEGIFLAFKQNRALKEPLPLSLVTSLLYRSWTLDGTIPLNYNPSAAEPGDPMPMPRAFAAAIPNGADPSFASATTSAVPSPGLGPRGGGAAGGTAAMGVLPPSTIASLAGGEDTLQPPPLQQRPSLLAALSARNSRAVTPLPSSPSPSDSPALTPGQPPHLSSSTAATSPASPPLSSSTAAAAAAPKPPPLDRNVSTASSIGDSAASSLGAAADSEDSALMLPPPLPSSSAGPRKPAATPLQPTDANGASSAAAGGVDPPPAPGLESMGACGESGKLKLDVLRGSRWRTERDVASGSDVI
ncbi:hypothetical protein JCM6882_001560 [Rhodosporidiobolus microsporus]